MADVNANVETEDDGSSNHDKDPMDDDDSDDNIDATGPSNKKGPLPKISFSHVHREFKVSIFFTS